MSRRDEIQARLDAAKPTVEHHILHVDDASQYLPHKLTQLAVIDAAGRSPDFAEMCAHAHADLQWALSEITRLRGDLVLIAEYRKDSEPQDYRGADLRFVRGIAEISLKGEVK